MSQKLLTTSSAKVYKSLKYGYTNYILYMAPHTLNSYGKNLCPSSTEGCRSVCLYGSGRGVFNNVQTSRIKKSDLFISDLNTFKETLYKECTLAKKRHLKDKKKYCIRLNGTTDIMWENIRFKDKPLKNNLNPNIFELFPEIQFLDYTKILGRSRKNLPKNYYLVYSFDGDNLKQVKELLDKGNGVAVVFKESLPKKLGKYKVIDGDLSDLRFLDKKMFKIKKEEGYIIGLTYKKNKLDNESNNLKNNFIYDSQKHKF